jgi:hypothetical protein
VAGFDTYTRAQLLALRGYSPAEVNGAGDHGATTCVICGRTIPLEPSPHLAHLLAEL